MKVFKLCFEHLERSNILITLISPHLKEFLVSRSSRGMITTIAFWHCTCSESPDVIRPLAISSGESWSTLFAPPRMKTYFMLLFLEKFKLFSRHSMFWYLSSWIPEFNVSCIEKQFFQTSGYLLKFDIKESPINITFSGDSYNKTLCCLNFSYQPSFTFLGTGIASGEISIEGLLQINSVDDKLSCC